MACIRGILEKIYPSVVLLQQRGDICGDCWLFANHTSTWQDELMQMNQKKTTAAGNKKQWKMAELPRKRMQLNYREYSNPRKL